MSRAAQPTSAVMSDGGSQKHDLECEKLRLEIRALARSQRWWAIPMLSGGFLLVVSVMGNFVQWRNDDIGRQIAQLEQMKLEDENRLIATETERLLAVKEQLEDERDALASDIQNLSSEYESVTAELAQARAWQQRLVATSRGQTLPDSIRREIESAPAFTRHPTIEEWNEMRGRPLRGSTIQPRPDL